MKKLITLTAAAGVLLTLVGCTVSKEDYAHCDEQGGEVVSEKFTYSSGWLGDKKTGKLWSCQRNGTIIDVYNDLISDVDRESIFGPNNDNISIFDGCTELNASTYKTTYTSGKHSYTRYACIRDGGYVQILE